MGGHTDVTERGDGLGSSWVGISVEPLGIEQWPHIVTFSTWFANVGVERRFSVDQVCVWLFFIVSCCWFHQFKSTVPESYIVLQIRRNVF